MATEMLNAYFYKRNRENYLKLIELAINGKIYISESSEKQNLELAFISSHKKTIKPTSK